MRSHIIQISLSLAIICNLFLACASNDDDDAINQRSSYKKELTDGLLPSPKQVAEEARLYKLAEENKDLSQARAAEALNQTHDDTDGLSDMTATFAQVLVPRGADDPLRFAPVKGRKVQETGRRKPIYLGKIGFETIEMHARGADMTPRVRQNPGTKSLSAKFIQDMNPDNMGTYVVKSGDSLSTISKAIYGVSNRWMELAHLNRLGNGSIIYPKEIILYVPDKKRK